MFLTAEYIESMKRKLRFTITSIRRQATNLGPINSLAVCHVCNAEMETLTSAESIAIVEIENPTFDTPITDDVASGNHGEYQ